MTDTPDLAALIGSRICHDLISPIGAISNGVELLAMTGAAATPEMELISASVAQANARIRFFRIAFGVASEGQAVGRAEAVSILDDMTASGRIRVDWAVAGDLDRQETKLAFLLIQCLETALAFGGTITLDGPRSLRAEARRLRAIPDQWAVLEGRSNDVSASHVHFALAAHAIAAQGATARVEVTETTIRITF
ncbi:histidine phosphotransferase family protein [Falsirhodobacter deserti]|uniref:histidine phosphotransferase family protein n=1 Tax=Falsirhodobacter deserti TaxID=1365611 RepID=UPI000FE411D7|nr:histidine phosphotransferase family protein [Falsirhodobacter deserti]